ASIFERSSISLMRLRRWVPAAFTRRSGSSAFSVPKRAALVTIISVRPMMALSGVRSSWLMLARNCDLFWLASASCRFLSWISSKSRTFSIAITAWSAKVVTRSICCWVNGRTVLRCRIIAQQWQPQHRASAADLRSWLQGVFRIGQNSGDLDDASFLQDTTEDRFSPGWDSMLFHERLVFGRITVKGNLSEGIAIRACDANHFRQARGGLDQRLKHG